MARTRNASSTFHQDDGMVLGKDGQPIMVDGQPIMVNPLAARPDAVERAPLDRAGNYISPAAALQHPPRRLSGGTVLHGPGAEPVPPPLPLVGYRADPHSWSKNMEAWELAMLIDLWFRRPPGELGVGFLIELTVEEYGHLEGNLRRHFLPVRQT